MNKLIKDKWVEALRSGKYEQGHFALRKGMGKSPQYCCLGVLADILGVTWKEEPSVLYTRFVPSLENKPIGSVYGFNEEVFGLTHKDQEYLYKLNDFNRWSFRKIADYVEENL